MPKTILLADHSTTIHRLVSLALGGDDVTLEAVQDGPSAIEAIERHAPDLVIADVALQMPTGWDIAAYVRAHVNLESIPVLLLAGAFDAVDGDHALVAGADGVITKPFDPLVLRSRVLELLASGRHVAVTVEGPAELKSGWDVQAHDAEPASQGAEQAGASAPIVEPASDRLDTQVEAVATPATEPVADAEDAGADEGAGEDYFDRIDQQFAALSRTPRPPVAERPELPTLTWDEDLPLAAPIAVQPVVTPVPAAPAPVPLTDAFAALLAAERTGAAMPAMRAAAAPAAAPSSSDAAPVAPVAPPIDIDALAEQVARRVLAQLSEQAVRDTVRDLVTSTTERLVREEIERIKRNIK